MKRLCTICARGGSRGVPNKNIRDLAGKPLIAHTIAQAKESGLFQSIAVSSDSEEILAVSAKWGADCLVRRPAELATDQAAKLPAIQHAVREAEKRNRSEYDVIIDLDATSPLRSVNDIRGAIKLLEEKGMTNVITGCKARRSPYFNLVELDGNGFVHLSKKPTQPIVRRQDAPQCFDMNASIYVWKREALFNQPILNVQTMLYEMPDERSLDIDSELDFTLVAHLMAQKESYARS